MGIISLVTGMPGASGFGSASTAEQVTEGVDASNLTAIVTGGAGGIGTETVRVLALRGAHVIIAARNLDAANDAKQLILKDNAAARVDILKLDLSSLKSIRAFVDNFNAMDLPLNILINNAGVMFCPYQLSQDGIEMQFATNHLGHFHLTNLLLEKMKQTAGVTGIEGRIVNLSSIAHLHTYEEGIRFDGINDQAGYSDKKAYGQSKLSNILHANELSRRFKLGTDAKTFVGPGLQAIGACGQPLFTDAFGGRCEHYSEFCSPGANNDKSDETLFPSNEYVFQLRNIKPSLATRVSDGVHISVLEKCTTEEVTSKLQIRVEVVDPVAGFANLVTFFHTVEISRFWGAATTCYVALHPSLKGQTGKYFLDCNEFKASPLARDEGLAKKLWDFSNKLINSAQQR